MFRTKDRRKSLELFCGDNAWIGLWALLIRIFWHSS